jgi:hypothetical protein
MRLHLNNLTSEEDYYPNFGRASLPSFTAEVVKLEPPMPCTTRLGDALDGSSEIGFSDEDKNLMRWTPISIVQ